MTAISRSSSSHLPARRAIKTLVFLIVGCCLLSPVAFAADSTWLLGDNGKIAVTTFEHRAGEGRATTITLIFGDHILRGVLKNVDSGRILLKTTTAKLLPENDYRFTSTIAIDYEKTLITLKGKLTVGEDEIEAFNGKIECKEMGEE